MPRNKNYLYIINFIRAENVIKFIDIFFNYFKSFPHRYRAFCYSVGFSPLHT